MTAPTPHPRAGLPGYPVLTLAQATAAMDAAYKRKGLAAVMISKARADLRASRIEFDDASRALARAEAAFRAAEERAGIATREAA